MAPVAGTMTSSAGKQWGTGQNQRPVVGVRPIESTTVESDQSRFARKQSERLPKMQLFMSFSRTRYMLGVDMGGTF